MMKNIPGFPGYKIDHRGTVWSNKPPNRNPIKKPIPWRRRKGHVAKDGDGYVRTSLRKPGGGAYTTTIHRLVGKAFVPNPLNLPEIDHLDTDKTNNHYKNLEWVTQQENKRRAGQKGLIWAKKRKLKLC